MKWAKDWWFEMAELDKLDEKMVGYMGVICPEEVIEKLLRILKGGMRFRTKLYGKVLIAQIMNEMGEGW